MPPLDCTNKYTSKGTGVPYKVEGEYVDSSCANLSSQIPVESENVHNKEVLILIHTSTLNAFEQKSYVTLRNATNSLMLQHKI